MNVDNILLEEIQTIFQPFNIMQWFFLLPKYSFYENFIFFNSRNVDLMSILSVIIPTVSFIVRILKYPTLQSNVIYNVLATFDCIFFCLGFLISFVSNLYHRQVNVSLVLNIQSIFKLYKFNKHHNVTNFNAVTWFGLAAIVLYSAFILGVYFNFFTMCVLDIALVIFTVHFDMNFIYASRIVTLIKNHMELWISELERISAPRLVESIVIDDLTLEHTDDVASIRMQDSSPDNSNSIQDNAINEWTNLFQGYRKIFETYDTYRKSQQIFILYGVVKSFLGVVFFVQYSIELVFDTPDINIKVYNITICMFTIKDLILLIVISSANQRFYITVEKVQCACLNIIVNSKDGYGGKVARQTCKNIVRVNKVSFERMQACRVLEVGAPLPLRFLCVVVDYVVVLIQIALGRNK